MILNTTYAATRVGTGVYTRNMLAAVPEATPRALPQRLLRATAPAFWTRRAAEVGFSLASGVVVHPYWAPDLSRRHVVSVLDFVQYLEATRLERSLLARAARRSGALLVLSHHIGQQIDWHGPRVVVAPPFPDPAWYEAPLPGRERRDGPLRIGYFGGWHRRKGIASFLTTLDRSSRAADLEVHCTGATAPADLKTLQVTMHGSLTTAETVALADRCDVVVYPSTAEGYGLPVAEALLRERPVICRDLPVYREFVSATDALHIPDDWDDPEELVDVIERAAAASPWARERALAPTAATLEAATRMLRSAVHEAVEHSHD